MDIDTAQATAHPALRAVSVVDAGVTELAAAHLWSMSEHELLDLRIAEEQTMARLRACVLAATREVDGRGAAVRAGAASTAAWLRSRLGQHPAAAGAEVRLAGALDRDLPVLRDALAAGEVSYEGARVVADAMRRLPSVVDAETRARGEAYLVAQARRYDPLAVARLGAHLVSVLDPENGRDLEREEARRSDNEAFTVAHGLHGDRPLRGRLDAEHGALLDDALSVLAAPRPAADGTPDPRSAEKRRADALMQLISWGLASAEMPWSGGEPVTMTVVTTPEHLQQQTDPDASSAAGSLFRDAPCEGPHSEDPHTEDPHTEDPQCEDSYPGDAQSEDAPSEDAQSEDRQQAAGVEPGRHPVGAHLEDGTPLSPEATRRLGCDAWLVAAIRDSAGALLDIGRRSRIVNGTLRRALILRDGGCAFPGCGRPARWCHAHHIWHWAKGGPTEINNLVLLCPHHHRTVHHRGWTVHLGPDRLPVFTPPRWVDPDQTPRTAWRPPTHLLL